MMLDISEALFPTTNSRNTLPRLEPLASEDDDNFGVEKILILAFLQKYWEPGLFFVADNVRRIDVCRLSENHWKSSSSPDSPNTIFCTLDLRYPAESCETLIHEASHLALYRLENITPLQTSKARVYRHAWKPDFREARGALLAAHAFLNVSDFYIHLSKTKEYSDFYFDALDILKSVGSVIDQLRSSENLSCLGRIVASTLEERFLKLTGEWHGY